MEGREIRRVRRRVGPPNYVRGPRQQLLLPVGDLGGMDANVLGQFGQRLVAVDRGQRHLSLEGRPVIPSRSLHRLAPLVRHSSVASVKPGSHLSHCPNFRAPSGLDKYGRTMAEVRLLNGAHVNHTRSKMVVLMVSDVCAGDTVLEGLRGTPEWGGKARGPTLLMFRWGSVKAQHDAC